MFPTGAGGEKKTTGTTTLILAGILLTTRTVTMTVRGIEIGLGLQETQYKEREVDTQPDIMVMEVTQGRIKILMIEGNEGSLSHVQCTIQTRAGEELVVMDMISLQRK